MDAAPPGSESCGRLWDVSEAGCVEDLLLCRRAAVATQDLEAS